MQARGAVLVLALFFIVLATTLAVLVGAGGVQFTRTTRQEHERLLLRQLIDSGRAWVAVHGDARAALPVTLEASDILPEDVAGRVTIDLDPDAPNAILVEARIQFPGRKISRTARFAMPP